MTKRKSKSLFIVFSALSLQLSAFSCQLGAQETDSAKLNQLEAQILANPKENANALEELSGLYFSEGKYNQLADFLKKQELSAPSACELPFGYYIGLCRYHQLRNLEETKNWQEYFDRGNSYREELFQETVKTVSLCPESPLAVKAQVINWLEHKAQNDSLDKEALDKLISLINNYVRQEASNPEVIRETADTLQREGETALAKAVYNLYVNRLDNSKTIKEDLGLAARSALDSGNISLAEIIYERYIASILKEPIPKEDLVRELTAIAERFSIAGGNMAYAEKIFTILEDSCGSGCFSEGLRYSRAYNLERLKDYSGAVREYEKLANDFPAGERLNEAEFRLGVLYVYLLSQKEKGLNHWQRIIERNSNPKDAAAENGQGHPALRNSSELAFMAESLYHRALISQYDGNLTLASADYSGILELTNNNPDFKELIDRVSLRQKEIQESRLIEHNLKTFLDISLRSDRISESQALTLDLSASPFKAGINEQVKFSLNQPQAMTGCLVPLLTYLWSGDLGDIYPITSTPEFSTGYRTKGVKVVNAAVLAGTEPAGIALEMVDINE